QCYVYRNIGQVNLGQAFQIGVTVENRGAEQADSIFVVMNASDTSVVSYTDTLVIEALGIEESTVILFPVTARKITDEVQFDAKVIRAKGHVSGLDVPVEGMSSSNGFVRIHEASALHFDVDTESGLGAFARGQSFKIMAAISRSGTSSLDNSGAMTITVPDGYTLVSPQSVSFSLPDGINVSQVYWDLQAPDVPKAPSAFTVTMTPRPNDRNLSAPVSVDNLQHSISVETMTSSMNITSIQILEPEGAKDGTVSTDQWFRIQATASFSENVRDHWAVLSLPVTDASNSYMITSVDSTIHSTSGVWIWQINAPSLPVSIKPFSVTVFGTEKTENDVSNTNAITVSTVRKTSLYVELSSDAGNPAGGLELSVGQEFELKVLVRNKGEANAKGLGWVTIDLGATGIATMNPVRQPYTVNDYVSWTLTAPNNPSPQQYLSVQIESIPQDENRTDTAYFENETLQLVAVKTMDEGRISQNTLAIESPLGAQDYIVSTGQSLTLRSEISWERLVGVSAQILYPSSFVCSEPIQRPENYESTHGSAVVTFNLTALTSPVTNEAIRVIVTGTDENDATRTLADTTSTVRMTVVEAAQAVVRAETDVQNNVVSVGQRFHVKGWLQNAGQARLTGTYTAELSSESTSYVVLSQIVQTRTSADTIAWTVQAPYTAISGQSLRVKVTQWPNDENKNAAPIITNSTVTIPIVTEEKEVIISQHDHAAPRSLTKGANGVPMLGFILRNNGNISSNPLLLRGIQVKLLDRNGEPIESPSAAIERLFAFRAGDQEHLFGEIR
ncbi:hypothetical protein KAH55_09830, partial [bacterium]|nr:hypothetical protein [bacterium]